MLLQYYSRVDNQWDSGWYHLAALSSGLGFIESFY